MKKGLFAGLAVLLICMFPVWCHAQEETETEVFYAGEWEYCLNEDGTATISHWEGEAESLVIPGELDGRRVTAAPGDTVQCSFAWPLNLAPGSYYALMQYSLDSFYAGIAHDDSE